MSNAGIRYALELVLQFSHIYIYIYDVVCTRPTATAPIHTWESSIASGTKFDAAPCRAFPLAGIRGSNVKKN